MDVSRSSLTVMVWMCSGQQRVAEGAGQGADTVDADVGAKVMTSLKGSMGERITKALSKVEEKKKKRAIRRAMVSSHLLHSFR